MTAPISSYVTSDVTIEFDVSTVTSKVSSNEASTAEASTVITTSIVTTVPDTTVPNNPVTTIPDTTIAPPITTVGAETTAAIQASTEADTGTTIEPTTAGAETTAIEASTITDNQVSAVPNTSTLLSTQVNNPSTDQATTMSGNQMTSSRDQVSTTSEGVSEMVESTAGGGTTNAGESASSEQPPTTIIGDVSTKTATNAITGDISTESPTTAADTEASTQVNSTTVQPNTSSSSFTMDFTDEVTSVQSDASTARSRSSAQMTSQYRSTEVFTTSSAGKLTTIGQTDPTTFSTTVTTEGTTPSGGESNTLAIAVGASIGSLLIIALIVGVLCVVMKRKHNKRPRRASVDELDDLAIDKKGHIAPASQTNNNKPNNSKKNQQPKGNVYFNPHCDVTDDITNEGTNHSGTNNQGFSSTPQANGNTPLELGDADDAEEMQQEPVNRRKKDKDSLDVENRYSVGLLDMGTEDYSASNTYDKLYNPTSSFGTTLRKEKPKEEVDTVSKEVETSVTPGNRPKSEDNENEMIEETDQLLEKQNVTELSGSQKTTEL